VHFLEKGSQVIDRWLVPQLLVAAGAQGPRHQ
jgi:hypothetical protein